MPRTVIVGDVHGCRGELERLLERIGVTPADRLIFVGDLVGRGPDTLGVLKLVRKLGAAVVRGNHEQKLISWREGKRKKHPVKLNAQMQDVAERLGDGTWRWLREMPAWLDVPEHGLRVVHAGVIPGRPIEETEPGVLMTIRGMTPDAEPTTLRESRPWGELYKGPLHVVFGHNAWLAPQIHRWATGIDTGCVYGGALTAMVLLAGEAVPPSDQRMGVLVSVPSARPYCRIRRDV
jgi:hypothetical protein